MVKPDYPINSKEQDLLNRSAMAKHVAKLVNDFESTESFVVGIEGEWGSGKTSFINLVKDEIDKDKAEIMLFNPWNFSSQDELIEDFFNSLFTVLGKVNKGSKVSEVFKKYKRKLKKFEIAPEFYGFKLFTINTPDFTSLESLRQEVETELKQLNKKILIIIDDIDRLDTAETLAIFKLVKITANFPNCIFFLAYDRARVTKRIDGVTNNSGEDYLKKIIQTTFRVPSISEKQIEKMVLSDIDQTLKDLFGDIEFSPEEKSRWSKIGLAGFPKLFSNIRDLKRFISSLRLNLSVIGKHEVNLIDFITLESIRVFAPDFYDDIPRKRWLFMKGVYGLLFRYHQQDKRPEVFQKMIDDKLGTHPHKDIIVEMVKELFPELNFQNSHGSDWDEIWRGNKQVCSPDKFDKYFELSVPSDELSEEEFELILEGASSKKGEDLNKLLSELKTSNKLRDFLRKTQDHFEEIYSKTPAFLDELNYSIASTLSSIGDEGQDLFDFENADRQFQRLTWRVCEKKNEKEKYNFLQNLLGKQKYLYQKVLFLRIFRKQNTGTQENLVEMQKVVDRLISEIVPVLEEALSKDTLKVEKRGGAIIWGYVDWGKEDELKKYLQKMADDDKDIFILLGWFKQMHSSSTKGEYYTIDKQTLWRFVDQTKFEQTLNNIKRSLTDEERKLKEMFEYRDKFFD